MMSAEIQSSAAVFGLMNPVPKIKTEMKIVSFRMAEYDFARLVLMDDQGRFDEWAVSLMDGELVPSIKIYKQ